MASYLTLSILKSLALILHFVYVCCSVLEPNCKYSSNLNKFLKTYTKCRISANDIRIERGRYEGLKVEDRICNTSNLNIEDEFHFLMTCSPLDNCRAKYFNII
jgi:hypothetical protein